MSCGSCKQLGEEVGNEKNNETLIVLTPILSVKDKSSWSDDLSCCKFDTCSARSYVMQGVPFIQGMISSIPIGGIISPKGFLPSVLLMVIMVTVVIVAVILVVFVVGTFGVVVVVAIVKVIIVVVIIRIVVVVMVMASSRACGFKEVTFPLMLWGSPPMKASISFLVFVFAMLAACASRASKTLSATSFFMAACVMAGALDKILESKTSKDGHEDNGMKDTIGGLVSLVNLTDDEDPIDEDGDTRVGDSEVSVSLDEISPGGKKSQESSIGDTEDGGKVVGRAIIV
nr:hypothetical protein [Tanacetum cinerariifolium]